MKKMAYPTLVRIAAVCYQAQITMKQTYTHAVIKTGQGFLGNQKGGHPL